MKKFLKNLLIKTNLQVLTKKITERINFKQTLKINGKKFIIPVVKNIGYDNLIFGDGKWKLLLFKKLLNLKRGHFIDIGVNVGQTLLALKSINSDVTYIGFEPNSNCVFYVNYLIKANNFKNSVIIPIGLYNETKIMTFDMGNEADQAGTLVENLRPGYYNSNRIFVPVFKFDNVVEAINMGDVSLLKIDVEGAELEVLQGMKQFMALKKPIIICEILWAHNSQKLPDCKKRNDAIIKTLSDSNYLIYQIIKSEDANLVESIKKISTIENTVYTEENRELCDYLLVHSDELKVLEGNFTII